MPQGTLLVPLFLKMQSNDIATRIDNETKRIQYADDTVNLTFDSSIEKSKVKLKQSAKKPNQYCHELQLTLNTSKAELMIIGRSKGKHSN